MLKESSDCSRGEEENPAFVPALLGGTLTEGTKAVSFCQNTQKGKSVRGGGDEPDKYVRDVLPSSACIFFGTPLA